MMRQVIAKRLTESKQKVPHSYLSKEIALDNLVSLRKVLNNNGLKLSVNDFVIKSVASALSRVPEVNVIWDDAKKESVKQAQIDISVAVAIDGGLITPIVPSANTKNLKEINETVKVLSEKAKKGTLLPKEYQGGTFTISNLGMFGISEFSAVINPPQAAILSVGGSSTRLVLGDDNIPKNRTTFTVRLNFDERAIDADSAAKFLQELSNFVENPTELML
eukprot:TRINITY_DN1756_c0_g3_i3.p1 TRINITY_DN1756_c0_g3~~TRINITY_DN1756_c0_g3_i3.p1  ORF type:complete len:220 (-),score=43.21 TRINITY_DN1756_c0_g3_i3:24-683(-)